MRIKTLVITGAVIAGVGAVAAAAWLHTRRLHCCDHTEPLGLFTTLVDSRPTMGEQTLLELLRQNDWPVDSDDTRFGTFDGVPTVRVRTSCGVTELQAVTGDRLSYEVIGYGRTFGDMFRTDVLPILTRGVELTYADFVQLETKHRPDKQFPPAI